MKQIAVKITGTAPLICHNERLASPLDQYAKQLKEISSKKKKTDADHELMAKIEYMGGLYYGEKIGPYLPGKNLDAMITNGGVHNRLGKQIRAAARVVEDRVPIKYKGPRDPAALFADTNFRDMSLVRIQQKKILRTRPIFPEWAAEFTVLYDENALKRAEIVAAIEHAGHLNGLGDYRPRFGRFTAEFGNA